MRSFKAYPSTVAPCEANRAKPRATKAAANAGFHQGRGQGGEGVGKAVLVAKERPCRCADGQGTALFAGSRTEFHGLRGSSSAQLWRPPALTVEHLGLFRACQGGRSRFAGAGHRALSRSGRWRLRFSLLGDWGAINVWKAAIPFIGVDRKNTAGIASLGRSQIGCLNNGQRK